MAVVYGNRENPQLNNIAPGPSKYGPRAEFALSDNRRFRNESC